MPTNKAFETPQQQQGTTINNLSAGQKYRPSQMLHKNNSRPFFKKHQWLVMMAATSCVVCLVLMLVYNRKATHETAIPIIDADQGPIKIRPIESNQAVPHIEKTIYGVLATQEPAMKVENLLSEPERPQSQNPSLPEDFMQSLEGINNEDAAIAVVPDQNNASNQLSTSQSQQAMLDLVNSIENPSYVNDSAEDVDTIENSDESLNINLNIPSVHQSIFLDEAAQQPFAIGAVKPPAVPEKQSNQVEMADVKVKSSKIVVPKISPKQPVLQKTIYRAQICSALSKKSAEQLWLKTVKKAPQILASYKPFYEKIDLGSKIGIRYRVQIGQFSSEAVHKFCQKLKAKGLDCVSVRQNSR